MTRLQLLGLLTRITYKPQWTVAMLPMTSPWMITISFWFSAQDADDPSRRTTVRSEIVFDEDQLEAMSEADVVARVAREIRQMELHEIDEWLRVDGERVKEPHKLPETKPGPQSPGSV